MNKKMIALGLLFSVSSVAEITNLHFYAKKEHFKEGVIEAEISSDISQLKELSASENGVNNAPIHMSVMDKNIDALKIFSQHEKYIDVKNSYDQTALMLALKMGDIDISKILINGGASKNNVDIQGNSVDAYAKVGEINLQSLYGEKIKTSSDSIEDKNKEYYKEESVDEINNGFEQVGDHYERMDRVEENLINIVDLISKHDNVIQDIESAKITVKNDLEKANKYISQLTKNFKKQAQVLIPIIKDNKYKITSIDIQLKTIANKAKELTSKIEDINKLKAEVMDKIKDVEEMGASLDKTKETLLKTDLEYMIEMEAETKTQNKEILEVDLLGDDISLNADLIKGDGVNSQIFLIEEEEKTIMDSITLFLEQYIELISLVALLSVAMIFIAIKSLTKKSTKKEKIDDDDDDDDDEDISDSNSNLNKKLDQIEIEEKEDEVLEKSHDYDDDIFQDIEIKKE